MSLRLDEKSPDHGSSYGNDKIGDCTIASLAYLIETWTGHGETRPLLTTDDVISIYSDVSGYKIGDHSTDVGVDMLTALKTLRGRDISGHVIDAYAVVSHTDIEIVKTAIFVTGGVYVGLEMPLVSKGVEIWSDPGSTLGECTPNSWGSHAVSCSGYDRTGVWLRTWGRWQRATWEWWLKYVDECYAIVSPDWTHGDRAINGLDMTKLREMLARIQTGDQT